jgi:CRISPR-associated protein Cas2
MKVIIVYDVNVNRVNDVRKVLKQYLIWVQNSVFEGELSESMLEELKLNLYNIIDPNEDSILVYTISNPKWINKMVWGIEKNVTDNVL